MAKFSSRKAFQWLSLAVIVMTVQTGSAIAQEFLAESPRSVGTVEIASALPSAPDVVFASGAAVPLRMEFATPMPVIEVTPATPEVKRAAESHRFWDRENAILFAAAGGMATADFFMTRANLQSGGRELNPITRVFAGSTPTLALNFGLETSGVMGMSYILHKTGHHKLERMVSLVNIGSSAGAVAFDVTHR